MDNPLNAKGRRGRKREVEEGMISEDDEAKKQKNRDAARKCRQNKMKHVEKLMKHNDELGKENVTLRGKKKELEGKVCELMEFIKEHIEKGCYLPPALQDVWETNLKHLSKLTSLSEAELNCVVSEQGSPMSTDPSSPRPNTSNTRPAQTIVMRTVSESSNITQPSISRSLSVHSEPPLTLFSGQPLPPDNFAQNKFSTNHKSHSQSHTPSSLSSSPVYSNQGNIPAINLADLLQTSGITSRYDPLVPIQVQSTSSSQIQQYNQGSVQPESQVLSDSSTSIPLVVLEEEGIVVSDQGLGQWQMNSRGRLNNMQTAQVSDILRQAREEPDMEVEGNVSPFAGYNTMEFSNSTGAMEVDSNNLRSDGFEFRDDSLSDKPQTVPVGLDSQLEASTSGMHSSEGKYHVVSMTNKRLGDMNQLDVTTPELIAQAVLAIPESQMAPSLKKQIHTSCNLTGSMGSPSSQYDLGSETSSYDNILSTASQVNLTHRYENTQQTFFVNQQGFPQQNSGQILPQTAQRQLSEQATSVTSLQTSSAASTSSTAQIAINDANITDIRYVQKKGLHLLLGRLPSGKFRVFRLLEDKTIVDTTCEIQLKDSEGNQNPAGITQTSSTQSLASPTSSAQVVPQDIGPSMNGLSQPSNAMTSVALNCAPPSETLPSTNVNLPSLTFNDFTNDEINVYAKKPRGNAST